MSTSSSTTLCFSGLLMKYGERKPRSNCVPSTTSSSLARPLPSSTVITPSRPTFSIASAIISPIEASLLAEIEPTWAISLRVPQGLARRFNSSTTLSTALSMPRFKSIGFMPAATYFMPSVTMPAASSVAVVVPSPATSEVLAATSRTICAPMFSKRSSSSISLATITPELITMGAPQDFSSTTVRALGPSVTRTASARMFIPFTSLAWADSPNSSCLAGIAAPSVALRRGLAQAAHHLRVGLRLRFIQALPVLHGLLLVGGEPFGLDAQQVCRVLRPGERLLRRHRVGVRLGGGLDLHFVHA